MRYLLALLIGFCFISISSIPTLYAQEAPIIYGTITTTTNQPLPGASVIDEIHGTGTTTDSEGNYRLEVTPGALLKITFSFVGFKPQTRTLRLRYNDERKIDLQLEENQLQINTFNISATRGKAAAITKLNNVEIQQLPSPTGGIEAILPSLPGVVSNNELSSQYSVRGGNFDENLIYVNDFEVFRPFLVRQGQQEGLSFINPDLVQDVSFSSGGFEAKYGDRLSSVLDVKYKRPNEFGGSFSASLLGANAHIEGISKNRKLTYLLGARYRTNRYLLNALPDQGEYTPTAADAQVFLTYQLTPNWHIEGIGNFGLNKFDYIPVESETAFGTFNQALALQVYFAGQEADKYQNAMTGLVGVYQSTNNKLQLKWQAAYYRTLEIEAFDILGAYRIGELEGNQGNAGFGELKNVLGVGLYHDWARNRLAYNIQTYAHKAYYAANKHFLSWGLQLQHENYEDELNEWYRLDSADYNIPLTPQNGNLVLQERLQANSNIVGNRYTAYLQDEWQIDKKQTTTLNIGIRTNYWDVNKEHVWIPRAQLAFSPNLKPSTDTTKVIQNALTLRLAAGLYYQPPIYRELRRLDGSINRNLKAQKSAHFVLGSEYTFEMYHRPFQLTTELYYKNLWDIVPYNIDNLLIRYFGENSATGYAMGFDARLNGEFIKGTDSWFSLSLLKTVEDLEGDFYKYRLDENGNTIYLNDDAAVTPGTFIQQIGELPRPTDQRFSASIFFQDQLPNNPNIKMNLLLVFGTGMPNSPPNIARLRNGFTMPFYRRADIGFSALLLNSAKRNMPEQSMWRNVKSIWASVEVFNLFGVRNTISYTWLRAANRNFGINNYLTNRRLNAKLIVRF